MTMLQAGPPLPSLPGLHWRLLAPTDGSAIAALTRRCQASDGGLSIAAAEDYIQQRYMGGSRGEPAAIGAFDLDERLAACVNIINGIESIYRWEGEVARDRELLLIIKTTASRYGELERRVKELHSYTTPEVIAFRIERGSTNYLNWIHDSTTLVDTD